MINLKHLRSFIPYQHFKMEGTSSLEGSTITKRFFMQTGSEGCILLHPNRPKVKEIYKILGRKPLRIYVPVFRTRSSSFGIYKTSESSNISVTKAKRKGNSISGRHVVNVKVQ